MIYRNSFVLITTLYADKTTENLAGEIKKLTKLFSEEGLFDSFLRKT